MTDDPLKFEIIYDQTGTTQPPTGQVARFPACSIRVTHEPTGIVAQCGWHRPMHENRQIASEMIEYALSEIGWKGC